MCLPEIPGSLKPETRERLGNAGGVWEQGQRRPREQRSVGFKHAKAVGSIEVDTSLRARVEAGGECSSARSVLA